MLMLLPLPVQAKESATRLVVIGDSLTAGYGVSKEAAFPSQLQRLLKEKGKKVEVINAGTSGSTSASALRRVKWHMRGKPKILLLALGANDGLRGLPVESTYKNLASAIDFAQGKGVKVYLAGMKIPMNYGKKYRADFEKTYQKLVREKKVGLIPFLLEGVGGEKALNLSDGIHPNEKGHLKIAQTLANFFEGEL